MRIYLDVCAAVAQQGCAHLANAASVKGAPCFAQSLLLIALLPPLSFLPDISQAAALVASLLAIRPAPHRPAPNRHVSYGTPSHCPLVPAALAGELGIVEQVEFCVNASFDQLRALLTDAVAGLHTMADEHFGISVVEYMAAGAGI